MGVRFRIWLVVIIKVLGLGAHRQGYTLNKDYLQLHFKCNNSKIPNSLKLLRLILLQTSLMEINLTNNSNSSKFQARECLPIASSMLSPNQLRAWNLIIRAIPNHLTFNLSIQVLNSHLLQSPLFKTRNKKLSSTTCINNNNFITLIQNQVTSSHRQMTQMLNSLLC